ncbi:MAG: 50S ribosomal protein L22 [Candidatus Latescibacteria bacterium]|jgi:large subunit ribosomal protein L22|nr:50S ribosomal protein L22 [Candidatus Latescibacterota bacterium]
MEARAMARHVRGSAKKYRQVVALIRGKSVQEALNILQFVPKAAAGPLEKTVRSAAANAVNMDDSGELDAENLHIKIVSVDGGPAQKRIHYGPRGMASRMKKRSSHITVVVSDD